MALPTLFTPRTKLQPWTEEDIDALHQLWTEPGVRRYLWDDVVITRETAEAAVRCFLELVESSAIGGWTIYSPPDAEALAGFAGFRTIDEGPDIELMYGLREQLWGTGLATEVSAELLAYLWRATRFSRVFARTDPPNAKSIAVMERLGFTHESTTGTMVVYVMQRPLSSELRPSSSPQPSS